MSLHLRKYRRIMETREPDSIQPIEEKEEQEQVETVLDTEESVNEEVASEPEEEPEETTTVLTREALIDAAMAIFQKEAADITAEDIRHLRHQYISYRAKLVPPAPAEDEEVTGEAVPEVPEDEEFVALMTRIKDKKAAYNTELEAIRLANLERKQAIIDQINELAVDTDNVNRTFSKYRELQDQFNAIGEVPPTEDTAIWKKFQDAREHYSDNLKINKELRDYDFKKNLDSKQLLLDEAEGLSTEEDVVVAYRRLQELHNKWRQIGPVAKEYREEIWEKFKAASAEVNKRYQAHFEARKAREAENEAGKTAICEELEAIQFDSLKSFAAWEQTTRKIIELQQKWRTYGYASKKMNKALFARFRGVCDKFFAAKAEYFHSTREELSNNLARKTALVERAEALKDSTDWKATTDELVALQKEWKTIGSVAKKYSDAIWQRFQTACDYFFEQKKQATSGTRRVEQDNLKAKREVLAKLDAITEDIEREEAIEQLRTIQDEWKAIGHVPFRDKDKINESYRTKVNALRERLNIRRGRENMERYAETLSDSDDNKLLREREKLVRALENRRQELRTYENNLGFLSIKSKGSDAMLKEFERNAERIRNDISDITEKIKLIDSKL